MDLSCADHIENLAEHEKVEYYSEMSGRSNVFKCSVQICAIKIFDHTSKHVLPVPISNTFIFMALQLLFSDVIVWRFRDELRTSEYENEDND